MKSIDVADCRGRLLAWYDANRRDLPWRSPPGEEPEPYRVWLSEVMLQQTRVDTVRPYFERWLARFPSLRTLSEASRDEVLKAWEGLGYYSRARNLHRAVREVVAKYDGRVPDDPAAFRSLPGVGRYTAGAVMSIAFGREEPAIDGNARRVFARLLDQPNPSEAELWKTAQRLVAGERPGDLNQALMDLGATICTPRSPACTACPVEVLCRAKAAGTQTERPAPRSKRPIPEEYRTTAVVVDEGRVLLARRPESGRLAELWAFPDVVRGSGETSTDAAIRAAAAAGEAIDAREVLGTVAQTLTHVRVIHEAVGARRVRADPERTDLPEDIAWVATTDLESFALPRAQRRIAALAEAFIAAAREDRRTPQG